MGKEAILCRPLLSRQNENGDAILSFVPFRVVCENFGFPRLFCVKRDYSSNLNDSRHPFILGKSLSAFSRRKATKLAMLCQISQ